MLINWQNDVFSAFMLIKWDVYTNYQLIINQTNITKWTIHHQKIVYYCSLLFINIDIVIFAEKNTFCGVFDMVTFNSVDHQMIK